MLKPFHTCAFAARLALFLASAPATVVFAQSVPAGADTAEPGGQSITISSQPASVPVDTSSSRVRMLAVKGRAEKQEWPAKGDQGAAVTPAAVPAAGSVATGIRFYPGDLSDPFSNPTIDNAEFHDVYLNALPAVWGYPGTFLDHLFHSDFIHVTDQYVGTTANGRYRVVNPVYVSYPGAPHILQQSDIFLILHGAASFFGGGYREVYHIYLPPGTDTCLGTSCYSPDNPSTFSFCAYHGAVTYGDIGHVIYSVQPYQAVPGCELSGALPNGVVTDSQASVLSHETFELLTDPDLDAWWNRVDLDLHGAEIGDECQRAVFNYDTPLLDNRLYEIQPEYSNAQHACVFSLTP